MATIIRVSLARRYLLVPPTAFPCLSPRLRLLLVHRYRTQVSLRGVTCVCVYFLSRLDLHSGSRVRHKRCIIRYCVSESLLKGAPSSHCRMRSVAPLGVHWPGCTFSVKCDEQRKDAIVMPPQQDTSYPPAPFPFSHSHATKR